MEEIEDNPPAVSSTDKDAGQRKQSPSKRKLDEMNAYLARTDTTKLFELVDKLRSQEKKTA